MSDIIEGFRDQVWIINKYDGLTTVWEERVPLAEATEEEIITRLQSLAMADLTPAEIEHSPDLFQVRKDHLHGTRLIYSAGESPHYVASLWRGDELSGS